MSQSFYYDGQIKRFLQQFIRIMSHFSVEFGQDRDGITALQQVPVYYGDSSRQVAQILQGNSENAMQATPAMAVYITGFQYDQKRTQEPFFVSKMNLRERSYDSNSDTWGQGQGDAYTIERMMPVPYKLTIKVDIWTSNTNQKLQLIEQISPLFNPAMEIQSTDNYVDWTSLSSIFLTDTSWSTRSVGSSTEDTIDIATLTFELPIWLSLPAKVKRLGVIEKIVASVFDSTGQLKDDISSLPLTTKIAQKVMTPMNYGVVYYNNSLQLYRPRNIVTETIDTITIQQQEANSWKMLTTVLGGDIKNGITQVYLNQPNGSSVVGTVSYHPTDPSLLLISTFVDTIPANNVSPVHAIIDPYTVNVDNVCLSAVTGDRYLILNDIGSEDNIESAIAWRGTDNVDLVAKANDIIEYNGSHWFVSLNSTEQVDIKYVTNLKTGIQFKWLPETQMWVKSVEGQYQPGQWTIIL